MLCFSKSARFRRMATSVLMSMLVIGAVYTYELETMGATRELYTDVCNISHAHPHEALLRPLLGA